MKFLQAATSDCAIRNSLCVEPVFAVFCYKTLHLPGPPESTSDPPAAPRLSGFVAELVLATGFGGDAPQSSQKSPKSRRCRMCRRLSSCSEMLRAEPRAHPSSRISEASGDKR